MADIRQAARWLQEGKRIHRPIWFPGVHYHQRNGFFIRLIWPIWPGKLVPDSDLCLTARDLLADDWEIFEERNEN